MMTAKRSSLSILAAALILIHHTSVGFASNDSILVYDDDSIREISNALGESTDESTYAPPMPAENISTPSSLKRAPNDATISPNNATLNPNDAKRNPNDARRNPNNATVRPNNATAYPNDATLHPNTTATTP